MMFFFFLLFILILWSPVQLEMSFFVHKNEYSFSLKVLLLAGLLKFEKRGQLFSSKEVLSLGPFSFQGKKKNEKSPFTNLRRRDFSLYRKVLPYMRLHLSYLYLSINWNGFRDPALMGIGTGLFYGLAGILSSYLQKIPSLQDCNLELKGDDSGDFLVDFQGIIRTRLGYSILTVFLFVLLYLKRGRGLASH